MQADVPVLVETPQPEASKSPGLWVDREDFYKNVERLRVIPLIELPDVQFAVESGSAKRIFSSSDQAKAFAMRIQNLIQGIALTGDFERIRVLVTSDVLPRVWVEERLDAPADVRENAVFLSNLSRFEMSQFKKYYTLKISLGALAFAQNTDELAALVAQAIARHNPQVWGFQDDPRLNRRLSEQINMAGLPEDFQRQIKADISALERVKSLGLRPWALTDYELRTGSFLRDKVMTSFWYERARSEMSPTYIQDIVRDPYVELRVIAQKITVAYMQERENISAQIQKVTPYDKVLELAHLRALRILGSTYSIPKKIRNWILTIVGMGAGGPLMYQLLFARGSETKSSVPEASSPVESLSDLPSFGAPSIAHQPSFFGHLWETVSQVVAENVVEPVSKVSQSVAAAVRPAFHLVGEGAVTSWNATSWAFKTAWQGTASGVSTSISFVYNQTASGLSWTGGQIKGAAHFVGDLVTDGAGAVGKQISHAYNVAAETAKNGFDLARPSLEAIGGAFSSSAEAAGGAIAWTAESISRGFVAGVDGAGRAISAGWSSALYGVDVAWDFMKVTAIAIGEPIAQGAANAYTAIEPGITTIAPYAPITAVAASVAGAVYYFRKGLTKAGRSVVEGTKKGALTLHGDVLDFLQRRRTQKDLRNYIDGTLTRGVPYTELEGIWIDLTRIFFEMGFGGREKFEKQPAQGALKGFVLSYRKYWRVFGNQIDLFIGKIRQGQITAQEAHALLEKWSEEGTKGWFFEVYTQRRTSEKMAALYAALLDHFSIEDLVGEKWNNDIAFETCRLFYERDLLRNDFNVERLMDLAETVARISPQRAAGFVRGYLRPLFSEIFSSNFSEQQRENILGKVHVHLDFLDRTAAAKDLNRIRKMFIGTGQLAQAFGLDGFIRGANLLASEIAQIQNLAFFQLSNVRNIQELIGKAKREYFDKGIPGAALAPVLHKVVMENPRLISSYVDALILLKTEEFWPEWRESGRSIGELEAFLVKVIETKRGRHQRRWAYEPRMVEELHRKIVERLVEIGAYPKNYEGLKDFWMHLTERGVTAETDRLLQRLIDLADSSEIQVLKDAAVNEGRVWETDLHSRLAIAQIKSEQAYLRLLHESRPLARKEYLFQVIDTLSEYLPEKGIPYVQFLENLSVQINSTYAEAKIISDAKTASIQNDSEIEDTNYKAIRAVFESLRKWKHEDQLNFLLYVRGAGQPSRKLSMAFRTVGVERVRRMYEILPVPARVGLLDAFFTHSLASVSPRERRGRVTSLARSIIGGQETESQVISHQLLTAFLHAVGEVGNGNLTSTILAYLYALPSTATESPGETLKQVLEVFGATGIKVGQFLLAAQILPPEESRVLRSLQDRAKIPSRMEVYEDVMDILGVRDGSQLPFSILDLLGAASMKYAFLARDTESFQKLVVKIFRLEAKNNVDMQFDVLESMARYLVAQYGAKYGVLEVIIQSARTAVNRERNTRHEIYKSQIARHAIYVEMNEDGIEVETPQEDLVRDRMIVAQYAEGVSFNELPERWKGVVARKILLMEKSILFGDEAVIRFDPDRHAGNYLIRVQEEPHGALIRISPIDFGQVLRISSSQRERVVRLFALAQIVAKAGMNEWLLDQVRQLIGLNDEQTQALRKTAKKYVEAARFNPVTIYISLLAAIRASGFGDMDISYIDFVRGIIQLTQYESYAKDIETPSRLFEQQVYAYLEEYLKALKLDSMQVQMIRAVNRYREFKGFVTRGEVEKLPEDPSQLNFSELIRRDRDCETLLKRGAEAGVLTKSRRGGISSTRSEGEQCGPLRALDLRHF